MFSVSIVKIELLFSASNEPVKVVNMIGIGYLFLSLKSVYEEYSVKWWLAQCVVIIILEWFLLKNTHSKKHLNTCMIWT